MFARLLNIKNDKSFFLFGPRGTGKTTWVKASFPKAVYIDLLEAELFNRLTANPQRLEQLIPNTNRDWIVIDDVQRVPEILNEVHRLIETKNIKFILTGSSARKLRKKGPNLLGGRALTYSFHPLTAVELKGEFNLNHSLKFGMMPCVYTEKDAKAYLASYVKTYLEEEVRQEGITRNLSAFTRFLESASFSQGQVLNISSVARECHVDRKAVENYFSVLEDLLIAYRVPVFTKKAKRRMITHPKFYFFDAGVYRSIRPMGPLDDPENAEGLSFETLFFQELLAINDIFNLGYKIFYWRTSNDVEVDFILYGERGLLAFEVKRNGRIKSEMFSGLKAFAKDYPMAKTYLIYSGMERFHEDKIEIIPIRDMLVDLPAFL
jgi:predicted AAA+ superfamily ATPase